MLRKKHSQSQHNQSLQPHFSICGLSGTTHNYASLGQVSEVPFYFAGLFWRIQIIWKRNMGQQKCGNIDFDAQ